MARQALLVGHSEHPDSPALHVRVKGHYLRETCDDLSAKQCLDHGSRSLEGDVLQPDLRHGSKGFQHDVGSRPVSIRPIGDGILGSCGHLHEFAQLCSLYRRMHHQTKGMAAHGSHADEVVRAELCMAVQLLRDRVGIGRGQQDRVAIGWRLRGVGMAEESAGAGFVLDDDGLPEKSCHARRQRTGDDVHTSSCGP